MSHRAGNLTRRLPEKTGAFLVGLYVLSLGYREASLALRLRRRGLTAEGTVVENVRCTGANGPSWAPVVSFTDRAGNQVEFTPSMRGPGVGLSTGRTVEVIYLPEASPDARVNTWQHLLLPSLFAAFAGVALIAFALLFVVL
ncbi:DUF3592 domain-containing protein [Streptomyces bathyalis]|uniref:DUF3592 domain-containing protein n=1 Tax=Streptomyces bathyalis TaxID=2710756 RepID=A0A7T1WR49_9ACTN|nr:DUF3592 domain-containing protein [Streptomyces bathyalis]QPP06056.1 DUF3592 domain-containing protein [Streptomyces bathyalis]